MRGSPLLRAVAVFLALLSLALPLRHLLRADEPASGLPDAVRTDAVQRKVQLALEFTTPPKSLRVLSLGREIWAESQPAAHTEHELSLVFPRDGVDLQFELDWPENSAAAAKVSLTDPDGLEHSKTIWSRGPTTEVLTFP